MTQLPLLHFALTGDGLPDRLICSDGADGFTLPGADALGAFAELLGQTEADEQPAAPRHAELTLPALLPEEMTGCAELSREIDFGSLRGDRALLLLDHIVGRGSIWLGERMLARFDGRQSAAALEAAADKTAAPCAMAVDLTDALMRGRCETLSLRFESARPAGLCGPVFVQTTACAFLARARLTADARAQTLSLRVSVCAQSAGTYALRARLIPAQGGAQDARVIRFTLEAGETREAALSMAFDAPPFVPGTPYAPDALRLELLAETGSAHGALCDSALLACGMTGRDVPAFLPLTAQETAGDPRALTDALSALHIPAVAPAIVPTDALCRTLCRAGIAVRAFVPADSPLGAPLSRLPNVLLADAPLAAMTQAPEAVAWQLASMTAFPRAVDASLPPQALLAEVAGRPLRPDEEGVRGVLSWLCAVSVRLRAEAARQGRFAGALCPPGALDAADITDALRTAWAPLHLSALPLYGAWWTGMHFSASLALFLPPQETRALDALAVLEDEDGQTLARWSSAPACRGFLGVLEADLPHHACVLTLTCTLSCEGETLETHALPVYVGERGPLEAAFG